LQQVTIVVENDNLIIQNQKLFSKLRKNVFVSNISR
jgi:hypothetical protein